jgi:RNA polymerase sigma-70 factor (ECF subfamily)
VESNDLSSPSDQVLIERVLSGDRSAYDALVSKYWRLVYAIGYAHLGHRETTEDLTQEVFLRVFLHLEAFDQNRPFTPWLTRIARNLAINWSRAGKRRSSLIVMLPEEHLSRLDAASTRESELEKMMRNEEADLIQRLVLNLPPDQREVVLLRYMEGMNNREIADRLGVHPATIGRHLTRAERTLRDEMIATLRQTLPRARPAARLLPRTLSVIGAAATLSGEARSLLMNAAGGLQQLSEGAAVAQASAAGLLAPLGLFWAWVVRGVGLALAGLATLCGVQHTRQDVDWSWLLGDTATNAPVGVAPPRISAEDALAIEEVRATFQRMRRLAAGGDPNGLVDCYDVQIWEHMTGLSPERVRQVIREHQANLSRAIASVEVDRIWVDEAESLELLIDYDDGRPHNRLSIKGPLVGVKAADWTGRFVKRHGQWRLFDQQLSKEYLEREGLSHIVQIYEVDVIDESK